MAVSEVPRGAPEAPSEGVRAYEPLTAVRWLRALLVVAIVLPIATFAWASWQSYRSHFADAAVLLTRTADIVSENAAKVFETQELAIAQVNQLLSNLSDDDIRAQEQTLSARLKSLVDLDQIQDITVIDKTGHPLLSGLVYPVPSDLDLSDRDYFRVHRDGAVSHDRAYVSAPFTGRVRGKDFFVYSKRRPAGSSQAFAGVISIAVEPKYFEDYYARVAATGFDALALVREDGALLARYPKGPESVPEPPADTPFRRAVASGAVRGFYESVSSVDATPRLAGYRRIEGYPIYAVVGRDREAIIDDWLLTMGSHLLFGIPATAGLIALTALALWRTRQQGLMLTRLRAETARREIIEGQLRQSQKMEAIGHLTGGLAHDFNNLLTIVLGNLDTMSRRLAEVSAMRDARDLAAVLAKPVEVALQGAQNAAKLTHRLLAFSRRQILDPAPVDLNRLITGMSELLRRTLDESIGVETILAGGLWRTFADAHQLENTLINLCVNARDAMPEGGRLTVETANAYLDEAYTQQFGDVTAGQYVMLSVADTGKGIPPDVLQRVFEPFFTTKPTGEGSGLGLAMVYGFVKQSGGHIRIYSELGHGTTVKIYLPRLAEEKVASVPAPRAPDSSSMPRASVEQEIVLLVEDNEGVRDYATSVLGELGYDVIAVPTATEALRVLGDDDSRVDLLFTDVVLPDFSGRELANRALELRPDLPVLFTTGYTRNAIIHHGRLDPDAELLTKPYTQRNLALKIREMLDRGSTTRRALKAGASGA